MSKKLNYYIMICIICLPFIFNWAGWHDFFSSPVSISIISVLLTLMLISNFKQVVQKSDYLSFLLIIAMLTITGMNYKGLGCIFACYNIFLMCILFNNITFEKKQVENLHLMIVVLLGIFFLTLKIDVVYDSIVVHQRNGVEINSNGFGILVLAFYFHFLLMLNTKFKKKFKGFLFLCVTPVAIYYVELSDSRSVYIALIAFLVMYLLKDWEMKNYKKLLAIFVIIAIAFPFVYLEIIDTLKGLEMGGKSLLSRELVWKSTIELINKFPILGSGTEYSLVTIRGAIETSSAHNVFLGLWKTVGIVPMIIIAVYLRRGENIKNISASNRMAKKMFLSCMIICALETLINDNDTYLFYMTLLLTVEEEKRCEVRDT